MIGINIPNSPQKFKNWLQTLGYSDASIYYLPKHIEEFFYFLKGFKTTEINQSAIDSYFKYLAKRPNKRQDGGLSLSYMSKQKSALKLYFEFLRKQYKISYQFIYPHFDKITTPPTVLTIEEVKLLFETCTDSILGKRNAVILVLFYSCGLRKAEGLRLKVSDIDLVQRQIFIRKSKTHQQRFVPMSKKSVLIIENYLYNAREFLIAPQTKEPRLLVGLKGRAISTDLLPKVLEKMIEKTKSKSIIQKSITLHKLRHSIATHLLANKMSLEDIAKFLGHKSLDSTQIYTHVAERHS